MTRRVEAAVRIARPAEAVFEFISTPANHPRWIGTVRGVHDADDGLTEGATWGWTTREAFGTERVTMACTAHEPPTRLAWRTRAGFVGGRVRVEERYTLADDDEATRLTQHVTLRTSALLRPFEPLVAAVTRRRVEANLEALCDVLERGDG